MSESTRKLILNGVVVVVMAASFIGAVGLGHVGRYPIALLLFAVGVLLGFWLGR